MGIGRKQWPRGGARAGGNQKPTVGESLPLNFLPGPQDFGPHLAQCGFVEEVSILEETQSHHQP